MTLTLRQIEAVYWVAKLRSFSAATKQLGVSQPAVSHRVREVEAFFGTAIFDRSHGLAPTAAGRAFLETAGQLIALNEDLLAQATQKLGHSGLVRIGAADTVALSWLAPLISRLARAHRRLSIEVSVDLSMNLMTKFISGDLDICFLVGNAPGPAFLAVPLGQVRNAWMAARSMAVPEGALDARQLAAFPVLTHSRGSHLQVALTRWFSTNRAAPPHFHSCNSLSGMIELASAGLGIASLPGMLLHERTYSDRLKQLEVVQGLPPTRFTAVFSDTQTTGLYRELVDVALEEVQRHPWFEPVATTGPQID